MAKNDVVLLDGILDQRAAAGIPSAERDEVFEFLVLDQLLKDYDVGADEIEQGWTDGRDDGGIDAFYVFVNGHLLDDEEFAWPRSNALLEVWLITCKHHATFRQATLDAMLATIPELFDLSISEDDLKGSYSPQLLALRSLFAFAYRRLSISRPTVRFHVVYASRGDTTEVGDSIVSRSRQIEALINTFFSSCSVTFRFVGAAQLVEAHRRVKTFSLTLPFLEHLATGKDSYVLLVRLGDYWQFVSDESGSLRRYLFDSNVRDYLGAGGVNREIAGSLQDESAPDFWWLNNGVTILATNATIPGKTIHLQDIQIVNGLQTTESIYRHFDSGSHTSYERALLVKIVVSSDPQVRDRIIRATNNQSPVEIAALHATDKIQRDIEAILERYDWYYERRRNYYRNIGKPRTRFIEPLYLASAMVALVLKNPRAAAKLRTKFMRTQEGYSSVFSPELPIEVWPQLAAIFKATDSAIHAGIAPTRRRERFIGNWRPLLSFLVLARSIGTFDYSMGQVIAVDVTATFTPSAVADAWAVVLDVESIYDKTPKAERDPFIQACCELAAERYRLLGRDVVGHRGIGSKPPAKVAPPSPDLVAKVDAILPPQPWKRGVHREVAMALNYPPAAVSAAISVLMAEGKRNIQRDGIVYDSAGRILAIDPDRATLLAPLDGSPAPRVDAT